MGQGKKHKVRTGIFLCLGADLVVVIGVNVRTTMWVRSVYAQSEELIAAEDFSQAKELLSQIKDRDYKDTESLLLLCQAHMEYDAGQLTLAHDKMSSVRFWYQSEQSKQAISAFTAQLNEDYDAYWQEEYRLEKEAYEKKIKTGVPYVGMPESRIGDTSLGAPSDEVRHNLESIGGEPYRANLYDFKVNGSTVFTARCVQGRVTQVWDFRDQDTSGSSFKPSASSKSSADTDPYHASDYSGAEEFYDNYYDDFFDYDDAEAYYNEHHS